MRELISESALVLIITETDREQLIYFFNGKTFDILNIENINCQSLMKQDLVNHEKQLITNLSQAGFIDQRRNSSDIFILLLIWLVQDYDPEEFDHVFKRLDTLDYTKYCLNNFNNKQTIKRRLISFPLELHYSF